MAAGPQFDLSEIVINTARPQTRRAAVLGHAETVTGSGRL